MKSREWTLWPYATRLVVVVGPLSLWEIYDHVVSAYGYEVKDILKGGSNEGEAAFVATCKRCNVIVLWLREKISRHACRVDQYDTLAHEAFHATYALMRHIGAKKLTKSNEESWAYMTGAIVGMVTAWLIE